MSVYNQPVVYNSDKLNSIREQIENMHKFNQIEILRILSTQQNVTLNENKYGIHINLSDVNNDILDKLECYIKYVKAQEVYLINAEKESEKYKTLLNDNTDNETNNNNPNNND